MSRRTALEGRGITNGRRLRPRRHAAGTRRLHRRHSHLAVAPPRLGDTVSPVPAARSFLGIERRRPETEQTAAPPTGRRPVLLQIAWPTLWTCRSVRGKAPRPHGQPDPSARSWIGPEHLGRAGIRSMTDRTTAAPLVYFQAMARRMASSCGPNGYAHCSSIDLEDQHGL